MVAIAGEIDRGAAAQRLMSDPIMVEAFETVKKKLIEQLESADVRDQDMEREIVRTLQLLKQLQKHLTTVIETGKLAQRQKEQLSWREKIRKFR